VERERLRERLASMGREEVGVDDHQRDHERRLGQIHNEEAPS
jgi:hypothetical protein